MVSPERAPMWLPLADEGGGVPGTVRVLFGKVGHARPSALGTVSFLDPQRHGLDKGRDMHCPFCRNPDSRVVDSREAEEGSAIRRRRACPSCGRRFTTVETAVLAVVKRSGVTEPFSREKVIRGVRRACQGRDVDDDALMQLAQKVEDAVRASGSAEIPSHEVGLAILGPLRDLDEVAYLRFASVYRSFSSADDFEREIQDLRQHRTKAK
ncbi:Transcriptional repressor NrdR [Smaragdicoccus niigatensis]